MMNTKLFIKTAFLAITLGVITSCENMLNTSSSMVMYPEDNKLDQPYETVYSVMGIINKMQVIADRTVLLGEIRGGLVELTPHATVQLQELANFTAGTKNAYNAPSDYYAVINNCNYFLATADTMLKKRDISFFKKEYDAVKTFRAWTYLQLAMVYGRVPFITKPILTEQEANKDYPMYGIEEICNYFIDDIKPCINTEFPSYGAVGTFSSVSNILIPVRALLGDLCLWSGRYEEAAQYYHDFLAVPGKEFPLSYSYVAYWSPYNKNFNSLDGPYTSEYTSMFDYTLDDEIMTVIPMERSTAQGVYSELSDVFNSTENNNYYCQVTPSKNLLKLSASQSYCLVYPNVDYTLDTLYAPAINPNFNSGLYSGDLRLLAVYQTSQNSKASSNAKYNPQAQTISKIKPGWVVLYRAGQIYLRFAEALNRAGFPQSAFAILKYGLTESNISKYISADEIARAYVPNVRNLIKFNDLFFMSTQGIHSRGSGTSSANKYYVIPNTLTTLTDSMNYVEDLICTEDALETAFEGNRFFDLIRMSLHRGDDTYLATQIAGKAGDADFNSSLYNKLIDKKNWYLPLK